MNRYRLPLFKKPKSNYFQVGDRVRWDHPNYHDMRGKILSFAPHEGVLVYQVEWEPNPYGITHSGSVKEQLIYEPL